MFSVSIWCIGLRAASICSDQCGRGGIGRRAALRSLWPKGRGSSSLLDRTIRNLRLTRQGCRGSNKAGLRACLLFFRPFVFLACFVAAATGVNAPPAQFQPFASLSSSFHDGPAAACLPRSRRMASLPQNTRWSGFWQRWCGTRHFAAPALSKPCLFCAKNLEFAWAGQWPPCGIGLGEMRLYQPTKSGAGLNDDR
jgi:hypothetical protein